METYFQNMSFAKYFSMMRQVAERANAEIHYIKLQRLNPIEDWERVELESLQGKLKGVKEFHLMAEVLISKPGDMINSKWIFHYWQTRPTPNKKETFGSVEQLLNIPKFDKRGKLVAN